jgi:hypothetical protein
LHVRPDLHVVADGDGGDVEGDQPEVGERPGADADLVAVVAHEGRADLAAGAEPAEELLEDPSLRARRGRGRAVEPCQELPGPRGLGDQLGVVGDVEVAGQHPLPLAPAVSGAAPVTHPERL